MNEQGEPISERLTKLKESIEQLKVKEKTVFSDGAADEFYRGFDHPIIGLLSYLKTHISYYETIECHVTGDLITAFYISDFDSYQQLHGELQKIHPKARLDFTFMLSNGIFPFLNNVQETFSVYFSEDKYEIDYEFEDAQHLTFEKEYLTHITPDEIRQLRNRIAETVYRKVSIKLDASA